MSQPQLDLGTLELVARFWENAPRLDEPDRVSYRLCRVTLVRLRQVNSGQSDIRQDKIVSFTPPGKQGQALLYVNQSSIEIIPFT